MPTECERTNERRPPFADAFREIHRFILKAMNGNAAAANALFQKYLKGEMPDELLELRGTGCRKSKRALRTVRKETVLGSLILKRANTSRPSGRDDYDVLENGVVVGRIFLSPAAPRSRPWTWASGHNGEIRRAAPG